MFVTCLAISEYSKEDYFLKVNIFFLFKMHLFYCSTYHFVYGTVLSSPVKSQASLIRDWLPMNNDVNKEEYV